MADLSTVTAAAQLEELLPLVAGYQRFYGAAAPDDDRNRAFFGRFVPPDERGLMIGAWDDGRAVGFATVYWTLSSTRAADAATLNDLFVAPGRRGAGLGRRLIEAAADAARERGVATLDWMTALDNRTAQRLYETTGAERSAWFEYELRL